MTQPILQYLQSFTNLMGHLQDIVSYASEAMAGSRRFADITMAVEDAENLLRDTQEGLKYLKDARTDKDKHDLLEEAEKTTQQVGNYVTWCLQELPKRILPSSYKPDKRLGKPVVSRGMRMGGPLNMSLKSAISNTDRQEIGGKWSLAKELRNITKVVDKLEEHRRSALTALDALKVAARSPDSLESTPSDDDSGNDE